MAPLYRLTYFNIKARAEPARLLLAYANIEYEDKRVEFNEWPALKQKMPWGKLPILEVLDGDQKGFTLSDSTAILQYLGAKHNFVGNSVEQTATCNEYRGAIADLIQATYAYSSEKDEAKKTELGKPLFETTFPLYLTKFNSILEENGDFLVGKSLTFVDLLVAHSIQTSQTAFPDLLDNYPALKRHQTTIFGLPGIKEWVEKRPVTQW